MLFVAVRHMGRILVGAVLSARVERVGHAARILSLPKTFRGHLLLAMRLGDRHGASSSSGSRTVRRSKTFT